MSRDDLSITVEERPCAKNRQCDWCEGKAEIIWDDQYICLECRREETSK